ncbi:MAG: divalent-cation tolerance protein CutA [candidate division SR1 bacterium]|nr:divalent-cation tolerance protein CutA [candidate division SR1 bacterium]
MTYIIIYSTYPNKKEAKQMANMLLDKHLIACANFFPIESMYYRKGKKESTKEIVALYKTQNKHRKKIQKEIIQNHSYDLPCIIKLNIEANSGYEQRVKKETT